MKRIARIGALAAVIIGVVATIVVGAVGVAVSIRVANNAQDVCVQCAFNSNNPSKEITVNADKGKLYYALENVNSKKTGYKVQFKTSNSASYTVDYSGYIAANEMVGYNYVCKSSGWTKRYFKVTQTNNLSSTTTKANFYAEVRK